MSPKITIERLGTRHARGIYENIRDREVVRWTLNIPHPYPKNGAEKFIRKARNEARAGKAYHFAIMLEGQAIGGIGLQKIDKLNKNAELGYWLGKKHWGKGCMTQAARLALRFGFGKLKLHRIYAHLFEGNAASRRVLEKSGFRQEALLKEARHRNGKYHNQLTYGILRSEFKG